MKKEIEITAEKLRRAAISFGKENGPDEKFLEFLNRVAGRMEQSNIKKPEQLADMAFETVKEMLKEDEFFPADVSPVYIYLRFTDVCRKIFGKEFAHQVSECIANAYDPVEIKIEKYSFGQN